MQPVRIGTWHLHPESRALRGDGEERRLTELERDLLVYLAQRAGRTVPTEQLLRDVWSYAPNVQSRAVTNLVGRLRRKLGPDGDRLVNVYGEGYRLDLPDDGELIGRRQLLLSIDDALAGSRHVTLYGLGGVGKTSLARSVASSRDTLWVDADGLSDEHALLVALARVLGMAPGRVNHATLGRLLGERQPELLVVDGAEGLGPVLYDWIGAWSARHPLRALITSRIRPEQSVAIRVDPLGGEAAVTLFQRRARAASQDAPPKDVVERLVQMVSGLPLALELAAARLRLLDARTLLADLEHDVAVLGKRAGSLDAMLEASWRRLDEADRHVLSVLAHIPRALDVDTLESACSADRWSVLDAVDVLTRSALVVDYQRRFRVLELVRRFVEQRAAPAATAAFLRWAVERADALVADKLGDPAWRPDALADEAPTLARAMALAEAPDDRAALALALFHNSTLYGRTTQLRSVFDELRAAELPAERAVDVLHARASTLTPGSDTAMILDEARAALEAALAHGTPMQVSRAWNRVVYGRLNHEGPDSAAEDVAVMLQAAASPEVPWPVARKTLVIASDVRCEQGRMDEALEAAERALVGTDPASAIGTHIVGCLARIHQLRGEPERSLPLAQQAHEAARAGSLPLASLTTGVRLLEVAWECQRTDLASALLEPLWHLAGEVGLWYVRASIALVFADLDPERARTVGAPTTFEEVAELARTLRAPTVEGLAWCEAGSRLHAQGDVEAALASYARARAAVLGEDPLAMGVTVAWEALAHWAKGETERAEAVLASPRPTAPQTDRLTDLVARAIRGQPVPWAAAGPRLQRRTLELIRTVGPPEVARARSERDRATAASRNTRR